MNIMKSDLVHSIVQMEPAILKQWMTEVKETVATSVAANEEPKSSLSLNLWAMRRTARYASNGRRKPGIITGLGY
jgi:hypothetical protein